VDREHQNQHRERLNLARDILLVIATAGGALILLTIAPGLGALVKLLPKQYNHRSLYHKRIHQRLNQLKQEGLIAYSEQNGKTKLYLTKAGKQKVLEYQIDEMTIPAQIPWDKKYRFVMFDIPEKQHIARDVFRQHLINLGFKKMQHSIWYHQYPCAQHIEFLTSLYHIAKYVTLIEGDSSAVI